MQDAGNSGQWNSSRRMQHRGTVNFAMAYRNFRNPSEIFAMHKFSLSYRNFASLAKSTVHSENFEFHYALYFR